jgi:hypothetical protein
MADALTRRGRVWGERNADARLAVRTGDPYPRSYGGPSMEGLQPFGVYVSGTMNIWRNGGYRRYAPPAP